MGFNPNPAQDYFQKYFPERKFEQFSLKQIRADQNWFGGWFNFLKKYIDISLGHKRKVLEIGCASGAFASILQDHNFKVSATDVSPYAIYHAKRFFPDINFFVLDIQKKINVREKYDFIFCFEVLEHLTNTAQALLNLRQLLSSTGTLIFSTPPPYLRMINATNIGHVHVQSSAQWQRELIAAGFLPDQIATQPVSFIPFFYRFSRYASYALPVAIDLPGIVTTVFYLVK